MGYNVGDNLARKNIRMRISTTGLSDAGICFKLFYYRRILRLVPKPEMLPRAMRLGIWIHACMECVAWQEPMEPTLDALEELALRFMPVEEVASIRQQTVEVMDGYLIHWKGDTFKPILVEKELEVDLGNGDVVTATLDKLAEHNGDLWVVEIKSTSKIPDALWRGVDPQTALQIVAARQAGYDVAGAIFDYLSTKHPAVPRVKVRENGFYANTGTTTSWAFDKCVPEVLNSWRGSQQEATRYLAEQRERLVRNGEFYQRWTVPRDEGQLQETLNDARHTILHLKLCEKAGYYPRSLNPARCKGHSIKCAFADLDASEYLAGRELVHMRKADFDIDDGSREGTVARAMAAAGREEED